MNCPWCQSPVYDRGGFRQCSYKECGWEAEMPPWAVQNQKGTTRYWLSWIVRLFLVLGALGLAMISSGCALTVPAYEADNAYYQVRHGRPLHPHCGTRGNHTWYGSEK